MTAALPDESIRLLELERKAQHLRQLAFATSDLEQRKQRLTELVAVEEQLTAQPPAVPRPPILRRVIPALPPSTAWRDGQGAVRGGQATTRGGAENTRGAATTGLDIEASLRMAHVPTGLIHLLEPDQHPLVTFRVHNVRDITARLRFTTFVDGYSAHAVDILEVPAGERCALNHLPAFFLDKTRSVTEICRAALHIQVQDLAPSGQPELHRTIPLWLLARTSAYLSILDPESGAPLDLSPYLGAWVTPNQPEVHRVLRQAVEHVPGRMMSGYQVDAQGVEAQVGAIYKTLAALDISYVNSVLTMGAVPGLLMQRVRLPRQSIEDRAANCLDATVLMASLLEAASLHPALVLIQGHSLLAWQTTDKDDSWDYVETTQLGHTPFAQAQALGRLTAERYEPRSVLAGGGTGHAAGQGRFMFRRLPLLELRRQCILPME